MNNSSRQPRALHVERDEISVTYIDEWKFGGQLPANIGKIPINDAYVRLPEYDGPCTAVARLWEASQPSRTETRFAAINDGVFFSP